MRISDWSSDVCSSDLLGIDTQLIRVMPDMFTPQCFITTDLDNNQIASFHPGAMLHSAENDLSGVAAAWGIVAPDSKDGMRSEERRVGKSVSVRVGLGGRRIYKKKKIRINRTKK